MRWWRDLLCLCLVAGASACVETSDEGQPEFDGSRVVAVVADPSGGGWVVGGGDGDAPALLARIQANGALDQQGVVPAGSSSFVGLEDGRLAVGVLRCEPVDECEATVSELVIVGAGGEIDTSTVLYTREGGAPDESDGIRVLGEVEDAVWVSSGGRWFRVRTDGEMLDSMDAGGSPCVIDEALHALTVAEAAGAASPTADPAHPDRYSVKRVVDGVLTPVDEGSVEGPSNSIADCIGDAFEVYTTDGEPALYWTAADGWTLQDWLRRPLQLRAEVAVGSAGHQFAVDDEGSLLTRVPGQWEPTGIQFDTDRPSGAPPLELWADRSRDVVAACALETDSPSTSPASLECHADRT